jgi:hypothetical protein
MDQKLHSNEMSAAAGPGGPGPGADLTGLHAAGADFLDAADAAIERALSRDSAEFLRANRQSGGE